MDKPISACFVITEAPGRVAHVSGHVSEGEKSDVRVQTFSFPIGELADAEDAITWLQMALARVCDGV